MDTIGKNAHGAIGFCLSGSLDPEAIKSEISACDRALCHFPWLKRKRLQHGIAQLELWSHHSPDESIYVDKSGNLFVLIGSSMNVVSWADAIEQLTRPGDDAFELPWEGRCILIRLSPDGKDWTMWNDWCGSIPVFHAQVEGGRIVSTLEPVVAAAAGYTPDDFFPPGLVSLLINGHYLGDWTLFKDMKVVPADCMAKWGDEGFSWKRLWTVKPSDERWDRGWDELIDEMYALSRQAIIETLEAEPSWILPLSGGLDSRLIAAVGAEIGVELHVYTYGHSDWVETVYARQVAETLGLPWQRIPIEPDYLVRYTRMWLEWFGSGLHCHGMYQMPFLTALDGQPPGLILQGYMGDPLAGNHVRGLIKSQTEPTDEVKPVGGSFCLPQVIKDLLSVPSTSEAIDAVKQKTQEEIEQIPGAWYQQLMFVDFWNRQRLFIYYQPMMYDYYRGVATPFFNREYARFCLSLSRRVLENRHLQKEMLRRYYPQMASIAGTFGPPLLKRKKYYLRKALSKLLLRSLCKGSLQEFATTGNQIQINALQAYGEESLWPLDEVRHCLRDLFDLDVLEAIYRRAAHGDEQAYNQLRPIQAIAWHFVQEVA